MQIIPAIDLRNGNVVRLNQGDFAKETTFASDPVRVARQFVESGAKRIHLVDLDGARGGAPVQPELCAEVARSAPVPIQIGGGYGSAEHVAMALAMGMDRVVLGTAAVEDPDLVAQMVAAHGAERIVVALDARDGLIAVSGWTESTDVEATALMTRMHAAGVRRFLCTDIARDAGLASPNFDALAGFVRHAAGLSPDTRVIASGGVGDIDHLRRLSRVGVEGAIIGSAIYRGRLDLEQAVAELDGP